MKVLFYVSSLTRSAGGLFFAATGLANALAERGVSVSAMGGADRFFADDRAAWGHAELIPHSLERGSYGFSPSVVGELRRQRPDLFHLHGVWSAGAIYGRMAVAAGIPTVVSPHGMLEPWILARRPLLKRVHAALFERPLLRRAWVHALNEAERDDVARFLPSARPRTFVVPNGVPASDAASAPAGKRGMLFLGRLHPKKQVVPLIRAWRALRLPPDETLTIAGWGDAGYVAEVERTAAGAGNVEVVGALHGEAKAAAFARARFFVLPSLSEGLPMAVLEALQHGCIPIVTPECNLPELFRDGIALRIARDFGDFAEVVEGAFALDEREAARRAAASVSYAANYAWPKLAGTMIEQYRRCIADTPPADSR